jgi:serine protease inhibitor
MKLGRIAAALAAIVLAANLRAVPLDAQMAAPPETDKTVAAGNAFGFRLLHTLLGEGDKDNIVISPLSVSLALAIVFNGAGGTTRDAMAQTLGIAALDDKQVNAASRQLLEFLAKADPAVQLQIANALWVKAGFDLNSGFVERTRDYYEATAQSLDFSGNPAGSIKSINDWVSDHTHGKIPTILDKVSRQTRLVVTDAVYFKGPWSRPFDTKMTTTRAFHLTDGSRVMTPMMDQVGRYPYLETPDLQAIRLPYGNRRFEMYIFLPRKSPERSGHAGSIAHFVRSLNENTWNDWTTRMSGANRGRIVLPRFELNYSRNLSDALKSMGMAVAFDPGRADLSHIPAAPAPLWIDFVQHKTYFKVDEQGTEAAATTAVGVVSSAVMAGPPPFEMVVDHPFFCAIAEHDSGAILFAGMITNPAVH